MRDNPVFRLAAKILFAPIILFGLYVQFHGDFGPGGGFQAGVIIAAAFILHGLVFGLEQGRRLISARVNLLVMAIGFALPKLNLTESMQKFVAYGFIYVAWSFTVFYWFGNAAGNRALTLGDNRLGESDIFGIIGFLPALPSVVLVVVLLVITVKGIFSTND